MSAQASPIAARQRSGGAIVDIGLAVLLILGGAASVVGVAAMGAGALAVPLIVAAVVGIIFSPYRFSLVLLTAVIVVEPGAIDFTRHLAPLLYRFPAGVTPPFTTSPVELAIVGAAVSIAVRGGWRQAEARVPTVAFAVLAAMAFGFLYGTRRGGDINIAYNEARGLLILIPVFFIAITAPRHYVRELAACLFIAAGVLGAVVLWRYFTLVRPGELSVPLEFAFAHEDSPMLGVGLVIGLTALARSGLSAGQRFGLIAYCLLVSLALLATQRRAATLVGIVGTLSVAAVVYRERPALITALAIPSLLCVGAYLGAYWDREYGTTAQPARAIRSQIDPSPRDQASDAYRDVERANVLATLRLNEVFGVGFGRPFAQFQAMVNLESFWPLQSYTPHQNVLWLWLKLGFLGLAAFLGMVAVALARCLRVIHARPLDDNETSAAIVAGALLLIFLTFGTVDIAFVGARETVLFGLALAVAFRLPDPRDSAGVPN